MGDPSSDFSVAEAGPRRSTFTPAEPEAFQSFAAKVVAANARQVPIDAPPPSPSTVVIPPPGSELPRPPRRQSLADIELLSTLTTDGGRLGTLGAIERLQQQLALREQEAREFQNWERSMQAIGTPEALDAVEETRPAFTEAIQIIPFDARSLPPQPEPGISQRDSSQEDEPTGVVTPAPAPSVSSNDDPLWGGGLLEATYDLVEPAETPRTAGEVELPLLGLDLELAQPESGPEQEPELALERELEPDGLQADVRPPENAPDDEPATLIETADGSVVETTVESGRQQMFSPETSGSEPVAAEHRVGRSIRLFWLWFAANSSVVSIIFGALLLSLGMSLRQAVLATLAGVAMTFLPLGIGTLASKWNGQPTLVISRASFGLIGNILPTVLAVTTRLLWGAVLLWLLASITAAILFDAGLNGPFSELQLTIIATGAAFLLALVVAFFGYALLGRVQLVLSILSGALIAVLVFVSWPLVNLPAALSVADGSWVLVLTGAVLVFSLVGLVWATSSGDVARYQRTTGPGAAAMLMAPLGTVVPTSVLIGYGALLAASDRELAAAFVADPVQAVTSIVPGWFAVPLIGAAGIGLLSGVILSIYSGGFAVQAIASRLRRDVAVLIAGIALGAIAISMTLLSVDLTQVFRDVATTLAVPTAAWVGIFVAEMMIRNRRFDAHSLLQSGGIYPSTRWLNLSMLLVASGIGYGLTTATASWLSWQGYLLGVVGIPAGSDLAESDIGVLVALGLALLTPIVAGIPAIRRQEEGPNRPAETVIATR